MHVGGKHPFNYTPVLMFNLKMTKCVLDQSKYAVHVPGKKRNKTKIKLKDRWVGFVVADHVVLKDV